jgi:hypothetical protein
MARADQLGGCDRRRCWSMVLAWTMACSVLAGFSWGQPAPPVTIVRDGQPLMPIVTGSVIVPVESLLPVEPGTLPDPITDLRQQIQAISGAELAVVPARAGAVGIYVGLVADFPWLQLDGVGDLGPEGFIVRSDGTNLYLLSEGPLGVQHAVTSFLFSLGQRWFFPGEVWQVTPKLPTIAGSFDQLQRPDFAIYRTTGWGYGLNERSRVDIEPWMMRNRWFGPGRTRTAHTWYGLSQSRDFEANPQWFALVLRDGELRRHNAKPCFSHPEVIEHIIENARSRAADGAPSISMSPPDGLNYCRCDRCFAVFQGGEPFEAQGTWFARRPDGVLVNVTSETLFAVVNKVAEALEEQFPDTIVASNAYSAYSHPPSFDMHPNVHVNAATSFRRTPLTLEEQLVAWGQRTQRLGIRDYWSVYQWDWDHPTPNRVDPHDLQKRLQFFKANNANAFVTESSVNYGPRGLGYYIGSHLLWDVNADVDGLIRDFYEKAFGPAAEPMQRYYALWYGPQALVLAGAARESEAGERIWNQNDPAGSRQSLRQAFTCLDEAISLVADQPEYRRRVDDLRLYMLYALLRVQTWEAAASKNSQAIIDAVREETTFGGRLLATHMIHSRALLGGGFERLMRRLGVAEVVAEVPELQRRGAWRQYGESPTPEEIEALWTRRRAELARDPGAGL